ncbi:MAG: hypothetical protein ACLFTA_01175 [Candidatus Nanohaloarchaea archaeon]
MDRKAVLLILLAAILLSSGCIDEGDDTESDGESAISVEELSVRPSQIHSGSSTTATLQVKNTGELPANLTINSDFNTEEDRISSRDVKECRERFGTESSTKNENLYLQCLTEAKGGQETGSDEPYGDRILTNRCRDIFDVTDFEVRGPGDVSGSSKYHLPKTSEVRFNWVLENINTENVPINGYSCNLKFQVPFDYSVTAYRQLQFKESEDVQGTPDLESRSSAGPMAFRIETIGSTSQENSTFLEGDQVEVVIYMENQKEEEGTSYTGLINAEVPEIQASNFDLQEANCGKDVNDTITMYEGESERIRCYVDESVFDGLEGSIRGEITAETNYTYVKDIGEKTVEVEYRGR